MNCTLVLYFRTAISGIVYIYAKKTCLTCLAAMYMYLSVKLPVMLNFLFYNIILTLRVVKVFLISTVLSFAFSANAVTILNYY